MGFGWSSRTRSWLPGGRPGDIDDSAARLGRHPGYGTGCGRGLAVLGLARAGVASPAVSCPAGVRPEWACRGCRLKAAAVMVIVVGRSAAGAVAGGVHGFAPALTSFVGRAGAVAEVAGLL